MVPWNVSPWLRGKDSAYYLQMSEQAVLIRAMNRFMLHELPILQQSWLICPALCRTICIVDNKHCPTFQTVKCV
jgi:hypothetical protein